jgi:ketosteroid isomerase-like protein
MKKGLIWLLCALLGSACLVSCGNNPKGVAKDFCKALQKGDVNTIVELMSEDGEGLRGFIEEAVKQLSLSDKDDDKLVEWEVGDISTEKGYATVKATLKPKDKDKKRKVVFTLVQEDGKWKVYSMESKQDKD